MRLSPRLTLLLSTVAAALCTQFALGALPKYPANMPWSPEVGTFALGIAFTAFASLFIFASVVLGKAYDKITWISVRLAIALMLAALMFFGVLWAPLAPALLIVSGCKFFQNCGIDFQGIYNVLTSMPQAIGADRIALICIAFVGCLVIALWKRTPQQIPSTKTQEPSR